MRRRRRRKQPDGPALPVVQCKPAKLVMHRSETSPAGSGGSTAGRALDPAGGGNGRPAQIRLPRASRLAAAGQGARLAGPPDPPGHLEPEFSGLNLHYVPPAGPAGPPARKLHPPGGEAGRTCRRPRPRRARRDKIRLAGWRETRRLAGSVSLKCHCIACGCGVRAGFHASLPLPASRDRRVIPDRREVESYFLSRAIPRLITIIYLLLAPWPCRTGMVLGGLGRGGYDGRTGP